MTLLVYDEIFKMHDTGPGHPENAQRIENTVRHLKGNNLWEKLKVVKPRAASKEEIGLVHPENYIDYINRISHMGGGNLDSDTVISSASYSAAICAAGAPLTAIDIILDGSEKNAFCLVRPPGHHATAARGMGFCLFNNVAIAARYLQTNKKLEKILIIDWDVHHGNGTQDIFYSNLSVLYFSMHRYPFYPGSGRREETGREKGRGFTVNVPLSGDTAPELYVELFTDFMKQRVNQFAPDFILLSAGFDAYKKDPIGGLNLDTEDFRTLTEIVMEYGEKHCNGRIVSCLEGGYNLSDLPLCIEAHLRALMQT